MTWEWSALAGLAMVALVSLVALVRLRRRTEREIATAAADAAELRARLERLEERRSEAERAPVADDREYTITEVGGRGGDDGAEPPQRLERTVFADHVLRESVIRLGSLTSGVRRALAPATRNRIRFEMKREVRRARKQRQADLRAAQRDWRARQRSTLDDDWRDTA